ncbi:diaminopimelate epimerase [Sporosarcina sp. Te-1]|uniref:diaminopimelate epimerase n=1 Tax=Sporosarcina sp. Te-1 TaxID=2818390 RepID=UPI001A9E9F67|nr:diaminopimelate epimerase [Sporosarcina sp. Te-1]
MIEIPFTKMHGLGNSYIYVDAFQNVLKEEWLAPLARAISNQNTGIGSDGLILIHPSDKAEVGMRIFNKDGSEGQSCGNGLRCVAAYAVKQGIVSTPRCRIETKAGLTQAKVFQSSGDVSTVKIDMGLPLLNRRSIPMLGEDDASVISESFPIGPHTLEVTALFLGNPHAVFFVDDINCAPLQEVGSIVTNDLRFPERVNVEFVEIINSKELNFRVWERGSGITEACGTGACAAVVASILNGFVLPDHEITVHLSGGDLTIRWAANGHVWMMGPAEFTAKGIFYWKV